MSSSLRIPFITLFLTSLLHGEVDLGSLSLIHTRDDTSPIPQGFVVGGVGIVGQNRYHAQEDTKLIIPGFVYFGTPLLYLGDRARYYFYNDNGIAGFGYGRFRGGNLDASQADFQGLEDRKFQLEAGVGMNVITPYALLTVRGGSDITGRTHGQEALIWADFPMVFEKLLLMPGCGMIYRSTNLANYYFGGISAQEAIRSPHYEAYDTHSTLSPMVSLISSYRFNKNWISLVGVNYERYDSSIKNSPLVQHSGEFYTLFGMGYIW